MRDDIRGGLKNALDRGEDLDSAVKSFINAGYSSKEVKEAAETLTGKGALQSPVQEIRLERTKPTEPPRQKGKHKPLPAESRPKKRQSPLRIYYRMLKRYLSRLPMKVIVLSSILLVLLVLLILSVVLRDTIVNALS